MKQIFQILRFFRLSPITGGRLRAFSGLLFLLLAPVFSFANLQVVQDSRETLVLEWKSPGAQQQKTPDGRIDVQVPGTVVLARPGELAQRWIALDVAVPAESGFAPRLQWSPSFQNVSGKLIEAGSRDGVIAGGSANLSGEESPGTTSPFWGAVKVREGLTIRRLWIPAVLSGNAGGNSRMMQSQAIQSQNIQVLQSFRLQLSFSGGTSAPALSSRHRVLRRVVNPMGARFFVTGNGVSPGMNAKKSAFGALSKGPASPLDDIEWVLRFKIDDGALSSLAEDGMQAVSWNTMQDLLQGQGLSASALSGLPHSRIRLYAGPRDTLTNLMNGPAPLPDTSMHQIPVRVADHSSGSDLTPDGVWGPGDTLFFFATGNSFWKKTALQHPNEDHDVVRYTFSYSPYHKSNYVYLGLQSGGSALDFETLAAPSGAATDLTSTYRYLRAEEDILLRDDYFAATTGPDTETGKEWFWFWGAGNTDTRLTSSQLSHSNTENLPSEMLDDGAWVAVTFWPHRSVFGKAGSSFPVQNYTLSAASLEQRYQNVAFSMEVNGEQVQQDGERSWYSFITSTDALKESGNQYSLTMQANNRQQDRFDGYTVVYRTTVGYEAGGRWVLPHVFDQVVEYQLNGNTSGVQVLRVKDGFAQGLLEIQNGTFRDSVGADEDVSWFLFRWDDVKEPAGVELYTPVPSGVIADLSTGEVNGSGISGEQAEYLIISPQELLQGALELADFRSGSRAVKPVQTAVVRLEDIYHSYSGGKLSIPAIRDFIRHAYFNWGDKLRYVLLLGDGHYDYRDIRQSGKPSLFPPHQDEELSSDDYYGILDSGEQISYSNYDFDVMVGRIPVSTPSELSAYVAKIQDYEEIGRLDNGPWRNTVLLTADDNRQKESVDLIGHTNDVEAIGQMLDSGGLSIGRHIDLDRLYLLDYEADYNYKKPDAQRDLIEKMNQGALFTIYFGHGASYLWADEGLLEESSLNSVENEGKYTILCSFACTVGRFDMVTETSLSEVFIAGVHKGAIASIGATRESFPTPNLKLAYNMMYNRFFDNPDGFLGDVFYAAKINVPGSYDRTRYNNQKYILLGEPVLSFISPSMNVSFEQQIDTLQALQKVKLSGTVDGAQDGKIFLQVFEGNYQRRYEDNYSTESNPFIQVAEFQGNIIHAEQGEFTNGKFSTEFISPSKISFGDSTARIAAYAWQPGNNKVGAGLQKGIALHGTSAYADSIDDQQAPNIVVRPCGVTDSAGNSFAEDQLVKLEIPACLEVLVTDSTGLDVSEQPDEGLSFELVDYRDPWHPYPFVEQTGKRIVARASFNNRYEPGEYLLRIRSTDILGNFASREQQIELTDGLEMGLMDVYNAPNPMKKGYTVFYFKDFADNHTNEVTIKIFNQSGKLVKVLHNARSGETSWDGRDQWGNRLANGLYYYKVYNTVLVDSDGSSSRKEFSKMQKLVISR